MANQFKVQFVKMTKDPARFARTLEKALNDASSEGWDIRIDYDANKGSLLILRKDADAQLAGILGALSMAMGVPPREQGQPGIPTNAQPAANFFEALLQRTSPHSTDKEFAEVTNAMLRKMPNKDLHEVRGSIKNLEAWHKDKQHEGDPAGYARCPSTSRMKLVEEALEEHLRLTMV